MKTFFIKLYKFVAGLFYRFIGLFRRKKDYPQPTSKTGLRHAAKPIRVYGTFIAGVTDKAIHEWNTAVGYDLFWWTPEDYQISIKYVEDIPDFPTAYGVANWSNKYGRIRIRNIAKKLLTTIKHELGHCLGLLHSEDPTSVMHKHAYTSKISDEVKDIMKEFK